MHEFVLFRDLPHQKMTFTALSVALLQSLDTIRESPLEHTPNKKRKLSRAMLGKQAGSLLHECSQFMGKVTWGGHGGIFLQDSVSEKKATLSLFDKNRTGETLHKRDSSEFLIAIFAHKSPHVHAPNGYALSLT